MTSSDNDRLWQRAWRYINANQAAPAAAMLESILLRNPADTRAHLYLSGIHASQNRPRAAARHIREAAATEPAAPELLLDVARVAVRSGEIVIARVLLDRPAIRESSSPELLISAALLWQLIGDNVAALAVLERARGIGADSREFHFYRATQLRFGGDVAGAEAEFARCIAFDPPLGHAFLQRALLRTQTPQSNHLPAIEVALGRVDPSGVDAAALHFARYKELEDLARYDEAWQALQSGNTVIHARTPHHAAREAALFDRLLGVCTPQFLRDVARADPDGPQPIFVIGIPRSGTTVLERVLGNHSQVEPAGESGAFTQALTVAIDHTVPLGMPDETTIARLPGVDWAAAGEYYLAQSQWRARGKRFYVDKLPRNWMLAGLIHKALPRARILNLVRDPMDVCFSNWRAYLGDGPEYAYAYDLDALASRHRQYRRVLAHWHAAMPRVILDVEYARLVREPEAVARDVFAFCGLSYEPGCTDLTRNPAPSATLSTTQVRQPIHAHAFGDWQPYAKHLSGLADALADARSRWVG